MACFKKDTLPYKYFKNLIPTAIRDCDLGMRELLLILHRMRLENAVHDTTDIIELAILELLLRSQTFCVTKEDLLTQVWPYFSTYALYCTPNLKACFMQTLRQTINVLTRTESHIIYTRKGSVHNLDMMYFRSEILDDLALYVERSRYENGNMENDERDGFRFSVACIKILIHSQQNLAKAAAASLQLSINRAQNKVNSISDNLEPLLDCPLSPWSCETVLKLHIIHSGTETRRSTVIQRKVNFPLPTFSPLSSPIVPTYSQPPNLSRSCRLN